MKREITTRDIVAMLHERYKNTNFAAPQHVHFDELRCGTGFGTNSERRIDFWQMDCYKSNGYKKTAYEIKVSRGDFLKEIKSPQKRRMALLYSNYFYFIAPRDMIKPHEVPPECGLMEVQWVNDERFGEYLGYSIKVQAPERDTFPPSWQFVGSLSRRIMELEAQLQEKESVRQ